MVVSVLSSLLATAAGATTTQRVSSPALLVDSQDKHLIAAGGRATVAWSGLPAGVEELELLLSVDGGRSYPLRLTPQLDPATGAVLWDVPNLPSRDARVRIRFGIGGSELDGPESEPFAIVGFAGRPVAPIEKRNGEMWPSRVPLPGPREGSSRFTTPAQVAQQAPGPVEADPVPTWSLSPMTGTTSHVGRGPAHGGEGEPAAPFLRRPRALPLRR
jgi:hypothetical protein